MINSCKLRALKKFIKNQTKENIKIHLFIQLSQLTFLKKKLIVSLLLPNIQKYERNKKLCVKANTVLYNMKIYLRVNLFYRILKHICKGIKHRMDSIEYTKVCPNFTFRDSVYPKVQPLVRQLFHGLWQLNLERSVKQIDCIYEWKLL